MRKKAKLWSHILQDLIINSYVTIVSDNHNRARTIVSSRKSLLKMDVCIIERAPIYQAKNNTFIHKNVKWEIVFLITANKRFLSFAVGEVSWCILTLTYIIIRILRITVFEKNHRLFSLLTTNICLLLPCPCSLDTFNPLVDTILH